jgi:carbamoyltransferase
MQESTLVREAWKSKIPAVCHSDGSARLQTVTRHQNKFLYDVIGAFAKETGIGVLLNTSFNARDEPIVESIDDAIDTFARLPIHWLVIPPFIAGSSERAPNPLRT